MDQHGFTLVCFWIAGKRKQEIQPITQPTSIPGTMSADYLYSRTDLAQHAIYNLFSLLSKIDVTLR
jgi:hypothetical protein